MWPVGPLNQLAAVADEPLKMPLRLPARLHVQRVRVGCFCAYARAYRTAGQRSPNAEVRSFVSGERYVSGTCVLNTGLQPHAPPPSGGSRIALRGDESDGL